MKEIYSKDEMVPSLCSEEEYASIPASTDRADELRRQREVDGIMYMIVGAENF